MLCVTCRVVLFCYSRSVLRPYAKSQKKPRLAMAHVNVSSSVLTIIASFSNGLDVLKKLRRSRKKSGAKRSKPSAKRNDEDARRLSRSLRRGPEDIGREYQAGSMHCDGERYAVGDGRSTIEGIIYASHQLIREQLPRRLRWQRYCSS